MAPFQGHYEWLGFEARRLILEVLEHVKNDPALTLDALIYESKEPDILARLEALGGRLRAIVDDHGGEEAVVRLVLSDPTRVGAGQGAFQ